MRENQNRARSVARRREDETWRLVNAILVHSMIAAVIAAYI